MTPIARSPNTGSSLVRAESLYRSSGAYLVSASAFFGAATFTLAATVAADGYAQAIVLQGPWSFSDASGWTLNASGQSAVILPAPPDAASVAVRLALTDSAHGVLAMISSTEDGRNGWVAGVVESGGFRYLRLSRMVEGQIVNDSPAPGPAIDPWMTTGVSDTPASGVANVDVSALLATGVGYTIDFRLVANVLEVRLNNDSAPVIKLALQTAVTNLFTETATFRPWSYTTFPTYKAVGFLSSVSGARVVSADAHPLTGQRTGRADVLVAVCGGNVYACIDGTNMLLVGSGVFPIDSAVSMAPSIDPTTGSVIMLMVGGGLAREFNPVSLLVSPWVATDGTLPGQTTPGTTTATILANAGVRVALSGIGGDEQNIVYAAVGDHRDLNTGKDAPGAAWATSGYKAARLGGTVVALQETTNRSLLVGTPTGIYLLVGDPANNDLPQAIEKSKDMGISGKDAMWLHSEGFVVAHSPQGLLSIDIGGAAINISRDVIDRGISFPEQPSDLTTIVVRDPVRAGVHVFLTRATAAESLHFWYDETVGGYRRDRGGYHPDTLPWRPLAAEVWRGKLVVGGDDGYIRTPVDGAGDDERPVDWFITMTQLTTPTGQMEYEISRMETLLSTSSAPVTLSVLRGRTSEDVFKVPETVLTETFTTPKPTPMLQIIRGPALLVRLAGSGSSAVESFVATVSGGSIKSGR